MSRTGGATPKELLVTCPPTELPSVSLGDLPPARRSFSDLRHRVSACPMSGEEQPAPPQHQHDLDSERTAHQRPMKPWRTAGASDPATHHDPQRKPEQGGAIHREEPVRQR